MYVVWLGFKLEGNDHEIEFQEIETDIFHKIKTNVAHKAESTYKPKNTDFGFLYWIEVLPIPKTGLL
jgi:hypothetical protein